MKFSVQEDKQLYISSLWYVLYCPIVHYRTYDQALVLQSSHPTGGIGIQYSEDSAAMYCILVKCTIVGRNLLLLFLQEVTASCSLTFIEEG